MKLKYQILATCLEIALCITGAVAQRGTSVVKRVTFPPGRTTAVLKGTIKRGVSHDYLLRARANQSMAVHLASSGEVGFEIISPSGQDLAGYTRDWSGYLPRSGDYRVNVLPPTETNAPAQYTLEITIR